MWLCTCVLLILEGEKINLHTCYVYSFIPLLKSHPYYSTNLHLQLQVYWPWFTVLYITQVTWPPCISISLRCMHCITGQTHKTLIGMSSSIIIEFFNYGWSAIPPNISLAQISLLLHIFYLNGLFPVWLHLHSLQVHAWFYQQYSHFFNVLHG